MTKIFGATTVTTSNNTSLVAAVTTVTQVTSSLAQYASADLNFTLSKTGSLASLTANRSCLVRVYSTSAARSADSRAYNVDVPAAGIVGLIVEVEIDLSLRNNVVTNIVFANEDSPQSELLYFKVFNLGAVGTVELDVGVTKYTPPLDTIPVYGSCYIASPSVKSIPLFTATIATIINELKGIKTASGTATLSIQINGVNVTGLTNLSITSTAQNFTATALNTVAVGARVTVNITAVSSATDLEFTMGATLN